MPSDVDKAYIKKYKINDMLNELFSQIVESKPDNPTDFAKKHFESKLPPPPVERQTSLLVSRIPPLEQHQYSVDANAPQDNLLAKIFNRANLAARPPKDGDAGGVQFPLATLNIMVYYRSL